MTAQQIHESSALFSQYPLQDFKQYVDNMRALTDKRKLELKADKEIYECHRGRNPRNEFTSRGQPFWDTHKANDLLAKDVRSGKAKNITPLMLYSSRPEYQEFDLDVFRKHIYQEIRKQEGQAYWLVKRNLTALKVHLAEAQVDASKWEDDKLQEDMGHIEKEWAKKVSLEEME